MTERNLITPQNPNGDPKPDFKANCQEVQIFIGNLSKSIMHLHDHPTFRDKQQVGGQHNEMHANLQLTFRHLEDAHHRLSKAIQAYEATPKAMAG